MHLSVKFKMFPIRQRRPRPQQKLIRHTETIPPEVIELV